MPDIKLNISSDGYKKIDSNIFHLDSKILEEYENIYNDKNIYNGYENTSIINDQKDLIKFNNLNSSAKYLVNKR